MICPASARTASTTRPHSPAHEKVAPNFGTYRVHDNARQHPPAREVPICIQSSAAKTVITSWFSGCSLCTEGSLTKSLSAIPRTVAQSRSRSSELEAWSTQSRAGSINERLSRGSTT